MKNWQRMRYGKKIGENPDGTAIMKLISSIEVPDVVVPERIDIELTPEIRAEWKLANTVAKKLLVIGKLLKLG
ncbi:hypothetical protein HKBW3S25_02022 [Candidatus Hakubella thermalkaliphila]|uniref:Uncharacterized protein n=1 Tax=Candidatus Hakubella thermalkaliphila TaxID=2754717 RepID=A0A6V8P287_9ACTN|nr:hypothetical protein HKBW3S25_02022 [Candidatus Hakubella thermalkaliphila]